MAVYPQISIWILVVTSVILFWVALTDFREFRIPNEMVLAQVALYVLYSLVSGQRATMPLNIGFALLMLAGMIYAWRQQMGGGDLKLLAAAFLSTGLCYAAVFSVLLLIFIAIHYAAARLGWAAVQRSAIGLRIPLAPAVAAALIGTFALDFVGPA
jgi:Flp pilus assembly protein protease CpaA